MANKKVRATGRISKQREIEQKKRKVGRFDLNDNLIETFNSATQAAKEYGSAVWHVLAGRSETQKGFKFKYLS